MLCVWFSHVFSCCPVFFLARILIFVDDVRLSGGFAPPELDEYRLKGTSRRKHMYTTTAVTVDTLVSCSISASPSRKYTRKCLSLGVR